MRQSVPSVARPAHLDICTGALVCLFALLFKAAVAQAAPAKPVTLDFLFDTRKFSTYGFPRHCNATLALYNEKKSRPLFPYGWGIDGTAKMTFEKPDSQKDVFERRIEGLGTIGLNGYSCTVLQDWYTFACAPWLKRSPRPIVYVTFRQFRDFAVKDADVAQLFKDEIAALASEKEKEPVLLDPKAPPLAMGMEASTDIEVKAAGVPVVCTNVPLHMAISGRGLRWTLTPRTEFSFSGAGFGFKGPDAGRVSAVLFSQAYCGVPEALKPVDPKDAAKKDAEKAEIDDFLKVPE